MSTTQTPADLNKPFFVYGTLRPEDSNNKPWRKDFLKDHIKTERARITNAILYFDDYPLVELNGQPHDVVIGDLIFFPPEVMAAKIKATDLVESCPAYYKRTIVKAQSFGTNQVHDAYIYYRKPEAHAKRILSGDFLNR